MTTHKLQTRGFLSIFLLCLPIYLFAQTPLLDYPETRRVDQVDWYHGVQVQDPYRWIEDMNSDETRLWVRAQDALTDRYTAGVQGRDALKQRIEALQRFDRYGLPSRIGSRYFYTLTRADARHTVLYVQDHLSGSAQVVLDPHEHLLFQDADLRFRGASISPNGKRVAYRVGKGQSQWQSIYIRDVDQHTDYDDVILGAIGGISWDRSGDGFYYVRYPLPEVGEELNAALKDAKIYYHRAGTPQSDDAMIYERPDHPHWSYGVRVSHDGQYLLISATPGGSFSGMSEYLFYKDLEADRSDVVQLFGDKDATFGFEGNRGTRFWFRTDYKAPNARLIEVDINNPASENWTELIPEADESLNTISVVGDFFMARYTRDARPLVRVFDMQGRFRYDLDLPGIGSVNGLSDDPDTPEAFYAMNLLYDPGSIYRLDVSTGQSTLWKRPDLPYDPDDFESKQVFYESKDGTQVPMFILHEKGLKLDGRNPVYMYAYGAYAWVAYPWFQPPLIAWLERGGVYALPNVRGGGEYGEAWHQAGIKINKQNAIDDYIAATEWLIDNGYTNPKKMAANGGSASGPLAAAAVLQRPDLYGAAIIDIPNLDLLRSHLFPGGRQRVPEYGSSDDPEEFEALYAYSPYHNIEKGTCYPPTLVTVGSRDEVAVPLHGYKFVAAMQHNQPCEHPVLLNVAWEAGHSYGLTPEQNAETWSKIIAFMIRAFEMDGHSN